MARPGTLPAEFGIGNVCVTFSRPLSLCGLNDVDPKKSHPVIMEAVEGGFCSVPSLPATITS